MVVVPPLSDFTGRKLHPDPLKANYYVRQYTSPVFQEQKWEFITDDDLFNNHERSEVGHSILPVEYRHDRCVRWVLEFGHRYEDNEEVWEPVQEFVEVTARCFYEAYRRGFFHANFCGSAIGALLRSELRDYFQAEFHHQDAIFRMNYYVTNYVAHHDSVGEVDLIEHLIKTIDKFLDYRALYQDGRLDNPATWGYFIPHASSFSRGSTAVSVDTASNPAVQPPVASIPVAAVSQNTVSSASTTVTNATAVGNAASNLCSDSAARRDCKRKALRRWKNSPDRLRVDDAMQSSTSYFEPNHIYKKKLRSRSRSRSRG